MSSKGTEVSLRSFNTVYHLYNPPSIYSLPTYTVTRVDIVNDDYILYDTYIDIYVCVLV